MLQFLLAPFRLALFPLSEKEGHRRNKETRSGRDDGNYDGRIHI